MPSDPANHAVSDHAGRAPGGRGVRHCRELLGRSPSLGELVPVASRLAGKLSRSLAAALAPLTGGEAPVVGAGMPLDVNLAGIDAELDTLALHSLFALGEAGDCPGVLATIGALPLLALVDRAFGGNGREQGPAPEALPLSAELFARRLDACLGQALDAALGVEGAGPVRRDTSLQQLAPFAQDAELIRIGFEVESDGFAPWSFDLAFPLATLAMATQRARPSRGASAARPVRIGRDTLAAIPVELGAVLVDMPIDFARLARLSPGDLLPVAVARSVPLRIGDLTVARGTLGEFEDRVAIQLHAS